MNGRQVNMVLKRLYEIEIRIKEIADLQEVEPSSNRMYRLISVPSVLRTMDRKNKELIKRFQDLDKSTL